MMSHPLSFQVHVIRWQGDLTVKMKLHSLKVKDELQGSSDSSPQYLACSVQRDDDSYSSRNILDPHENEPLSTEDDDFKDALSDFLSFPDSADALITEKDLGKGRSNSADVFYEAQDVDDSNFVSLSFSTRNTASPDYDGIDTQVLN